MVERPVAVLAARSELVGNVLLPEHLAELARAFTIDTDHWVTDWDAEDDRLLSTVEFVISGWGAPLIDESVLVRLPKLRAICHAAGSVKAVATQQALERGVIVTSAAFANALPVAEFTLASLLMAAKMVPQAAAIYRADPTWSIASGSWGTGEVADAGTYRTTVGIIGASRIGRRVLDLLRPFDFEVLLHDPFVSPEEAAKLGARSVPLAELFENSRVVSLHAPDLPATRGMIDRDLLERLRRGSTFINTARPRIVDNEALREVLSRGEVYALLDVTDPEPLPPDDPLWGMPNVVLTPHWAGSAGNEQHRLGQAAIDEALRIVGGDVPRHAVALERWEFIA